MPGERDIVFKVLWDGRPFTVGARLSEQQLKSLQREQLKLSAANKTLRETTNGAAGSLRNMATAAGLLAGVQLGRSIVNTSTQFEAFRNQLAVAGGGIESVSEQMDYLRQVAEDLGLPLTTLVSNYARFSVAGQELGLEIAEVRDIFTSFSEASRVMQLTQEETNGVFRALTQVAGKGKLSAEELRVQLAERLPTANVSAARALNVTTTELDKMLKKGEILSKDFLPKFAAEIRRTYAEGVPLAVNSAAASFGRLSTSVTEASLAVGEGDLLGAVQEVADKITAALSDPETINSLKTIGSVIADVIRSADTLATVLAGIFIGRTITRGIAEMRVAAIGAGSAVNLLTTASRGLLRVLGGPIGLAVVAHEVADAWDLWPSLLTPLGKQIQDLRATQEGSAEAARGSTKAYVENARAVQEQALPVLNELRLSLKELEEAKAKSNDQNFIDLSNLRIENVKRSIQQYSQEITQASIVVGEYSAMAFAGSKANAEFGDAARRAARRTSDIGEAISSDVLPATQKWIDRLNVQINTLIYGKESTELLKLESLALKEENKSEIETLRVLISQHAQLTQAKKDAVVAERERAEAAREAERADAALAGLNQEIEILKVHRFEGEKAAAALEEFYKIKDQGTGLSDDLIRMYVKEKQALQEIVDAQDKAAEAAAKNNKVIGQQGSLAGAAAIKWSAYGKSLQKSLEAGEKHAKSVDEINQAYVRQIDSLQAYIQGGEREVRIRDLISEAQDKNVALSRSEAEARVDNVISLEKQRDALNSTRQAFDSYGAAAKSATREIFTYYAFYKSDAIKSANQAFYDQEKELEARLKEGLEKGTITEAEAYKERQELYQQHEDKKREIEKEGAERWKETIKRASADLIAQLLEQWITSGLIGLFTGQGFSGFGAGAAFGGGGQSTGGQVGNTVVSAAVTAGTKAGVEAVKTYFTGATGTAAASYASGATATGISNAAIANEIAVLNSAAPSAGAAPAGGSSAFAGLGTFAIGAAVLLASHGSKQRKELRQQRARYDEFTTHLKTGNLKLTEDFDTQFQVIGEAGDKLWIRMGENFSSYDQLLTDRGILGETVINSAGESLFVIEEQTDRTRAALDKLLAETGNTFKELSATSGNYFRETGTHSQTLTVQLNGDTDQWTKYIKKSADESTHDSLERFKIVESASGVMTVQLIGDVDAWRGKLLDANDAFSEINTSLTTTTQQATTSLAAASDATFKWAQDTRNSIKQVTGTWAEYQAAIRSGHTVQLQGAPPATVINTPNTGSAIVDPGQGASRGATIVGDGLVYMHGSPANPEYAIPSVGGEIPVKVINGGGSNANEAELVEHARHMRSSMNLLVKYVEGVEKRLANAEAALARAPMMN